MEKTVSILYGVPNMSEEISQKFNNTLLSYGIEVKGSFLSYRKSGIFQILQEHPEISIVVLTEYLETAHPYSPAEFEQLCDHFDILLIPIIQDEQKGTNYVKELLNRGILCALYASDATEKEIASLILRNRIRKNAKEYYSILNEEIGGANIFSCIEHIKSANGTAEIFDRLQYMFGKLDEGEFFQVVNGLPQEIKDIVSANEDYAPFLKAEVKKEEKSAARPIFSVNFNINRKSKEMNSEKLSSEQYRSLLRDVEIGVAGIWRKAGATYHAIQCANYLKEQGFRVALVENSKCRGVFVELGIKYQIPTDETYYCYEDIDYYPVFNLDERESLQKKGYNFIIYDLGLSTSETQRFMGTMDYRILVSTFSAWEEDAVRSELKKFEVEKRKNWFMLLRIEKEIREKSDFPFGEYVFSSDVISSPYLNGNIEFYETVFGEYLQGRKKKDTAKNFKSFIKSVQDIAVLFERKNSKAEVKEMVPLEQGENSTETMEKEDKNISSEVLGSSFPFLENQKKEKKKSIFAGRGTYFVTGLKSGCGVSHLASTITNIISEMQSVCITGEKLEEGFLWEGVADEIRKRDYDMLYSKYQNIVFDGGVYFYMSEELKQEYNRAAVKIMVCQADDSYLEKLAVFVREQKEIAEDFWFVFHSVPQKRIKEIHKIMIQYNVIILPVYEATDIPKTVRKELKKLIC